MIHFPCSCGNVLFFDNSVCLQCGSAVGYDPAANQFRQLGAGSEYRLCENGVRHGVCNWVIPTGLEDELCLSCQLTQTLPNLGVDGHLAAWSRMEAEKRRVIYSLCRLGLLPRSRAQSPTGLAFDFLAPQPGQPVLTGHADGIITINILEADDSYRESQRTSLHEPYRTLLGHFRHEIGHYYWDRFFKDAPASGPGMEALRAMFGDEQADYGAALTRHYEVGAPVGWADQFITAYASAHPWEDWAETWAQYLHIADAVETARAFGWRGEAVPIPFTPFLEPEVAGADSGERPSFVQALNTWAKISPALNEIGASLGQRNLYPFVLNSTTARKIHFVHDCIQAAAARWEHEDPKLIPAAQQPESPASDVVAESSPASVPVIAPAPTVNPARESVATAH